MKVSESLTVFFEEPFWIGIFESIYDGHLHVAKVTFGREPKEYEVQSYIAKYYHTLSFTQPIEVVEKKHKVNPKRAQRDAKKQMKEKGIGTKSQQALKLQHQENKQKRIIHKRKKKELEVKRLYVLKQLKKKEKHKGH